MTIQRSNYGTVATDAVDATTAGRHRSSSFNSSFTKSLTSLNGVTSRVTFSASTKCHHHATDTDIDEVEEYCNYENHLRVPKISPTMMTRIISTPKISSPIPIYESLPLISPYGLIYPSLSSRQLPTSKHPPCRYWQH